MSTKRIITGKTLTNKNGLIAIGVKNWEFGDVMYIINTTFGEMSVCSNFLEKYECVNRPSFGSLTPELQTTLIELANLDKRKLKLNQSYEGRVGEIDETIKCYDRLLSVYREYRRELIYADIDDLFTYDLCYIDIDDVKQYLIYEGVGQVIQ